MKSFPSLDDQASMSSDHTLLGDQNNKREAAGISVHELLHSSPPEKGIKLMAMIWVISCTKIKKSVPV